MSIAYQRACQPIAARTQCCAHEYLMIHLHTFIPSCPLKKRRCILLNAWRKRNEVRRMAHLLFPSLDEMLSPASLGAIEGRSVTEITRAPFQSVDALSGSRFLRITTAAESPARQPLVHYIVKRIAVDSDWLMRATGNRYGRAAIAWQSGLLDRVPAEIEHGVVAAAIDCRDGDSPCRILGPSRPRSTGRWLLQPIAALSRALAGDCTT